jgi:hypothetical protein
MKNGEIEKFNIMQKKFIKFLNAILYQLSIVYIFLKQMVLKHKHTYKIQYLVRDFFNSYDRKRIFSFL